METYKKKSLRFSGFAKEIRTHELNSIRQSSRHARFSFLRPIADEEDCPEESLKSKKACPEENLKSKIPVPGSKTQLSRAEMLKKFKEEKLLKKQKELLTKKPGFKCGLPPPKPLPVSSQLGALSRMQASFQSFSQKSLLISTSIKGLIKPLKFNKAEPKGIKNKDSNSNSLGHKPQATGITKPLTVKNKVDSNSNSLGHKPQATGITKPLTVKNKVDSNFNSFGHKPQATGIAKPPTVKSKVGSILSSNLKPVSDKPQARENKNKSSVRPPNLKPLTGKPEPRENKNKIFVPPHNPKPLTGKDKSKETIQSHSILKPSLSIGKADPKENQKIPKASSGPKPVLSRLLSKKSEKVPSTTVPKPNTPNKSKQAPDKSSKASVTTSKPMQFKAKSTINLRNTTEKLKTFDKKPAQKVPANTSTSSTKDVTFSCQLSIIEPVQAEEKSFAPKGFLFCPPAELHSSYFLEEGPTAIFSRLKSEANRTSTPKEKTDSSYERKNLSDLECSFMPCTALKGTPVHKPALEAKADTPAVSLKTAETLETIISDSKPEEKETIISDSKPEEKETIISDRKTEEKDTIISDSKPEEKETIVLESKPEEKETILSESKPEEEETIMLESKPVEKVLVLLPENQAVKKEKPVVQTTIKHSNALPGMVSFENSQYKLVTQQVELPVSPEKHFLEKCPKTFQKMMPSEVDPTSLVAVCSQENKLKLPPEVEASVPLLSASHQFKEIPVPTSSTAVFSTVQVIPSESLQSQRIKTRSYYRKSEKLSPERTTKNTRKKSTIHETTPKSYRKHVQREFTPRRSARLASKKEFDSDEENILDEQPSFLNTPEEEESTGVASGLTCVFGRLHLDSPVAATPSRMSTRARAKEDDRLSLLYTPTHKGRRATIQKSVITEDLMSFSPST